MRQGCGQECAGGIVCVKIIPSRMQGACDKGFGLDSQGDPGKLSGKIGNQHSGELPRTCNVEEAQDDTT